MWTINIVELADAVNVNVSRWPRGERYPVQLAMFTIAARGAESELALVRRAATIAAQVLLERATSEN
jgi:hypothetical protein